MNKFLVEELKAGMRFTKPVYIDENNILVGSQVSLKEDDIKRLMKWGIREVTSEGTLINAFEKQSPVLDIKFYLENYNQLLKLRPELVRLHSEAYKVLRDINRSIRNGRLFKIDQLDFMIQKIVRLLKMNRNVFIFLVGLEEGKDEVDYHPINVCFYALSIAITMKYDDKKLFEIGRGALLINSGMVQIPAYISHKQSNLTENELKQIKTHPIRGYQAIKKFTTVSEDVALTTLQHHENFDGSGYPRGLKGHEISEYSRIIAIADNFQALVEKRSYRDKKYAYKAMKQMLATGAKRFDPVILRLFISILSVYPIGSIVKLNTNSIGIVIGSVVGKPLRPIIKMIKDDDGNVIEKLLIVNLLEEPSLYIVDIIDEDKAGFAVAEVL